MNLPYNNSFDLCRDIIFAEKDFNSLSTRDKNAEFANSIDLDEVAHSEPPHLDLHCMPSSL